MSIENILLFLENHNSTLKMRKLDFQDIWETRFLLYSLPLLMESIAFIEKIKSKHRKVFSLLTTDEILHRTKFYRTYLKLKNML